MSRAPRSDRGSAERRRVPPRAGLRRTAIERALAEYEEAQRFSADRPEGRLNLAWLHIQRGELGQAEEEYLAALEMAPWFAATYVNLSDLYRTLDREDEGEQQLRRGLEGAALWIGPLPRDASQQLLGEMQADPLVAPAHSLALGRHSLHVGESPEAGGGR